jgi:hypothetical protein
LGDLINIHTFSYSFQQTGASAIPANGLSPMSDNRFKQGFGIFKSHFNRITTSARVLRGDAKSAFDRNDARKL